MNIDHSPPPWKIIKDMDFRGQTTRFRVYAGESFVGEICGGSDDIDRNSIGWVTREAGRANASLVIASPELLRELQHLVRLLEPLEIDGVINVPGLATLNGARAAIANALKTNATQSFKLITGEDS